MAFDDHTQSEIVFRGRVFNVRVDLINLPGRKPMRLDVVEHNGAVTVLPIDESGLVWFIRQYRHPAGKELLELPAGVMEEFEAPEVSAQRELREEIGMAAGRLSRLGDFYLAPGYSTEHMFAFLATDLRPAPLSPDEGEEITIEKIPVSDMLSLVSNGRIQDSKSLAVLFLWYSQK